MPSSEAPLDPPSPLQRSVFHYRDFQNSPPHGPLLKKLAFVAPPIEVTKEQKDALGKLNHNDLKHMGIWQTQEILTIMKQLTMQVQTSEIKNFFVRLQQ